MPQFVIWCKAEPSNAETGSANILCAPAYGGEVIIRPHLWIHRIGSSVASRHPKSRYRKEVGRYLRKSFDTSGVRCGSARRNSSHKFSLASRRSRCVDAKRTGTLNLGSAKLTFLMQAEKQVSKKSLVIGSRMVLMAASKRPSSIIMGASNQCVTSTTGVNSVGLLFCAFDSMCLNAEFIVSSLIDCVFVLVIRRARGFESAPVTVRPASNPSTSTVPVPQNGSMTARTAPQSECNSEKSLEY